jgi:hypothetical protein
MHEIDKDACRAAYRSVPTVRMGKGRTYAAFEEGWRARGREDRRGLEDARLQGRVEFDRLTTELVDARDELQRCEDDLIVRHEQLQEALDQLELFFDPRERNDVNIDAGDILRKHGRVGPGMERGRPDDELEAALDADNPDPPLRS